MKMYKTDGTTRQNIMQPRLHKTKIVRNVFVGGDRTVRLPKLKIYVLNGEITV